MDIREQVEQVLEERVRPMLHSHGGEVRLVDVRDGNVLVELQGACAGCPVSLMHMSERTSHVRIS
ncbi:MAG: NifU family protein [Oscillospiraceae bacterium]|nr:NifU family protein [Oscillospiraceae bacterium]